MINHTKNRTQVFAGNPAIRSTQKKTLSVGITDPNGTLNPRTLSGCFTRRTITPIDTSTNANSVPMFDISANVPTSNSPAGIATSTPATQVANAGVLNLG